MTLGAERTPEHDTREEPRLSKTKEETRSCQAGGAVHQREQSANDTPDDLHNPVSSQVHQEDTTTYCHCRYIPSRACSLDDDVRRRLEYNVTGEEDRKRKIVLVIRQS